MQANKSSLQCWVNHRYRSLRFWLHCLWILVAEVGIVALYGTLLVLLYLRKRKGKFNAARADQAAIATKKLVVYPAILVLCTLPLVSFRAAILVGHKPTYMQLGIAAIVATSNGWLSVLLFFLTRRLHLLGASRLLDSDDDLDSFQLWTTGRAVRRYGTTTICEAGQRKPSRAANVLHVRLGSGASNRKASSSADDLIAQVGASVQTETTVQVSSRPVELEDLQALAIMRERLRPAELAGEGNSGGSSWSVDKSTPELPPMLTEESGECAVWRV